MRIRFLMPLALLCLLLLPACQQAADNAGPKLAVVDMARIMRDSEPGKAGVKFLEGLQAEMQGKLNDIQARLEKDPKDEAAQKELQSVYMASQQRMQVEQQNVVNLLYDSIQRVLNTFRAEKGYEVIINAEAAAAFDAKADVTAAVIADVNKQKIDFKAVAAEAAPSQAAPGTEAKAAGEEVKPAAPAAAPNGAPQSGEPKADKK